MILGSSRPAPILDMAVGQFDDQSYNVYVGTRSPNAWAADGSVALEAGNPWKCLVWSPGLSLWLAGGTNKMYSSPDGRAWTARTAVANTKGLAWSPALAIAVVVATGGIYTSTDGLTWTNRTAVSPNCVAWSPALGQFVAGMGNGDVYTSTDGLTWTQRVAATALTSGVSGLAWSPSLALWVATGVGAVAATRIATSTDGITWTTRTHAFTGTTSTVYVAWSPTLSLFVALALDGQATSSPDGIAWTSRATLAANSFTSLAWLPSGAFAAGGQDRRLYVSADGISYTQVTVAYYGSVRSDFFYAIAGR